MKPSKFPRPAKKITLWMALGAGITAIALAVGIFTALPGQQEPVNVYDFSNIGMTEFWGDNQESYGPVTTDKIQTVFLSDTQTVTELLVKEGDSVKKGDLLMTFDTTLSELQLERKRLEMEKEKLQLIQEENKLKELLGTTPWEEPSESPQLPEPKPGNPWSRDNYLFVDSTHDGSTQEKPVICWLKEGQTISAALLEEIYADYLQALEEGKAEVSLSVPSNPSRAPEQLRHKGVFLTGTVLQSETTGSEETKETTAGTTSGTAETTTSGTAESTTTGTTESTTSDTTQATTTETTESTTVNTTAATTANTTAFTTAQTEATETTPDETTSATEPSEPNGTFYIIFRTSQDDMSNKEVLTWEGLYVTVVKNGFSFQFFPAPYLQELDPFYEAEPDQGLPELDFGFGYTAAELQKMITAQRKTIKDQEFKVRMAENAFQIMEKELSDGNIYAEIDGTIVSLLDEEESRQNKQPFLKLSGGGGFLIKGSVSELSMDSLTIGQEVTVNDWNTGGSYVGTIQEIGDFPTSGNGWTGMGNPTTTYYPFTVFVDETADLQSGAYASIQYASSTSSHGIYLENPFIRTEGAESYVLARNGAGRLEKRPVVLGKVLWGSYTEVLSGVTEEDWLAFPYGKEAKAGVPTKEGSLEELYRY